MILIVEKKKERVRATGLQRIMVPMDFSVAARKALRYAHDLAQRYRAHIILLHVVAPLRMTDNNRTVSAARRNLALLCKAEGALSKRCKAIVRSGIPFFEITQSAEQNRVELIILGRRDSTIAGAFGDGHTSDRVMRYSKCPVLIVAETGRDFVATSDGR